MATGTTLEGTIWTTRPMSPEIEAKYKCAHEGGALICAHAMDEQAGKIVEGRHVCLDAGCHCDGKGHEVNRRCGDLISSTEKPYNPGTPKSVRGFTLPPSVGIGLLDVYATARRRLDGLEPWPVHVDTAPRLSKICGTGDPKIRRAYREFIEAIVKSGGVPRYQFVVRPAKKSRDTEHRTTPHRAIKSAGAPKRSKHESKHVVPKPARPAADVRAGQIWEDCDKRHQRRRVEVLRVTDGYAIVKSARQTNKVLLSRFRATSTGYRLVSQRRKAA